ncbi:PREDICTED: metal tolerance protein A1-like [Ipomoea nil]|uniref:metal tolerance protein A1-like n=1 Tax=Ipomoea nil TaxID=35883 RepID=UPI000900FF09|nr:PREDICTED: metal tolerance protein A1-like [Ipomoea nil]
MSGFLGLPLFPLILMIVLLPLLVGILVYEVVDRLINDICEVQGGSVMFAVSVFGLAVNIIIAVLLGHDGDDDYHEGHSDHREPLLKSVGVMIGEAIIWYKPEWKIIDPFCTQIFSVLVLGTAIRMIRNILILEVLMESTPQRRGSCCSS